MQKLFSLILLTLFFSSCTKKETNWNVQLDKNSKAPYGCYIAYHALKDLFYINEINAEKNPLQQMKKSNKFYRKNETIIIVSNTFLMDSLGWETMQTYIHNGNHIILFGNMFSENILEQLHVKLSGKAPIGFLNSNTTIVKNQLLKLTFDSTPYDYYFTGLNIQRAFIKDSLPRDNITYWGYTGEDSKPNLLTYYDEGSLTVCATPLVMTNYFLLQNNNRQYYEQLLSNFKPHPRSVTWYSLLTYRGETSQESEWQKLLRVPAIFYAFLIVISLMILYVLFQSKRRQREIPVIPPNINTSLEFTETIGSLYYNKHDNQNLSEKMLLHYLETLRSKYNLQTNVLDDTFAEKLSVRINKAPIETKSFVAYLNFIRNSGNISDTDIIHLHQQLKNYS